MGKSLCPLTASEREAAEYFSVISFCSRWGNMYDNHIT